MNMTQNILINGLTIEITNTKIKKEYDRNVLRQI